MRRSLLLLCCCQFFLHTGTTHAAPLPSIFGLDSLGWSCWGFDGTVAVVKADDQCLWVTFESRSSSTPIPDSEPHTMSITRGESVSKAAWDGLVHRFQVRQGKPTTVTTINHSWYSGYISRGGIVLLSFPEDQFAIRPQELPDLAPLPRGSLYFAFQDSFPRPTKPVVLEATACRIGNTVTRLTPSRVP